MPFSDTARNVAATAITSVAVRASLHTADPGTTGASEVFGTGYTRQAATWDPAVGGLSALGGSIAFDVPAGATVTHAGIWTVAGVWLGGDAVTPLTGPGVYTLHESSTLDVT